MNRFKRVVIWTRLIAIAVMMGGVPLHAQRVTETEAWAAARFINTRAAYQWYLEMFPDGRYATRAFQHLAKSIPVQPMTESGQAGPAWDWGVELVPDEVGMY